MDDERRPNAARPTPTLRPQPRPEAAALAPTVTPEVALGQAPTFAVGSGGAPDARSPGGTMDLPTSDRGAPSPVQQMIGHFVVRYQLGEGGMGVVYAGLDPDLGRPVAIKLVRAEIDHDGYRARLLREAQAMARLEHPNVVRIYEVGNHAGRLFVAMELVDGETLSRWLRAADRGWRDIVAMFDQVGAGLSAVHRAGLVHRDFKPDNVLVDRGGRARVADFGLARLDPQGGASTSPMGPTLTRTGAVMGTPGYMAPEQQVGSLVDARADQYSFCVAMREALVGARAWDGVPKPVRAAVTRGLSYDASERFESVEALLAAVREAVALEPTGGYGVDATGKQHAAGGALPMPATMVVGGRRGRGWMFAAGGLAVVLAAGVTAYAVVRNSDAPAPTSPDLVASTPTPTPTPTATPIPPPTTTQPTAIATASPTPSPPPPTPVTTPPPRTRVESKPPPPTPTVKADKPPAPTVSVDPTLPAGVTRLPNGDIVTPLSKDKLPAANVQDPGHLGVVRATIFNLGYDGIDAAAMDRDPKAMQAALEAERDAATGTDQLVAKVKLGMVLRRRGDCGSAEPLWREATKALKGDATDGPWQARAFMGLALCALASGDPSDAFALVSRAWVHGDQPEVNVVMAVADYDQGKQRDALGLFTVAEHNSNPRVQEAVKRWLAGTGLTLPP